MPAYIPEYTVTNQILNSIAGIEYAKAIIESTTILPNWQKQLETEAKARTIAFSLQRYGLNVQYEDVKKRLNKMPVKVPSYVDRYITALNKVDEFSSSKDFDENDIRRLYQILTGKMNFRTRQVQNAVFPEEILAEMTKLLDWHNSLDARETHPVAVTAILKGKIEHIRPFDDASSIVSDLVALLSLRSRNYHILNYYALEEYYYFTQRDHDNILLDAHMNDDYTKWLEYFTEGFNREISNISEHVKIMARDTKLVKAAPNMRLTERQQRIVTYLQDYGMLQNKDFATVFPGISEDTVLRELKALVTKGVVTKRGSTKSSRYELT